MSVQNFTAAEWAALARAEEVARDVWRELGGFGHEASALERALAKAAQLAPDEVGNAAA
jgi:hypothetical protein